MQKAPDKPQETLVAGQGDLFTRLFRHVAPHATELVMVRHGEAAPNPPDALDYDPPLSERGRWQAQRLAERLAGTRIDALYASPLRRAQETAQAIASATGLDVETVPDLQEVRIDMARLREAFRDRDREALVQDLARRLLSAPRWDTLPGFEPSHRFRLRVRRALDDIVARHPGERVLVVCHGGVINLYLSFVLDIPRDIFFLPEHTSLTVVRVAGERAVIQTVADSAHLWDGSAPDFTQR